MEDISGVTTSTNGSAASPTATQTTSPSSADVNTQQVVQDQSSQTAQTQDDPLAGFPSEADLQAAVANKTPYAEQAARIKGAYESLKPQFEELQEKFQPVEPFLPMLDRFEKPEALQELVDWRNKFYGWQTGPEGLVPATRELAQELIQHYPQRAQFLAADLMNSDAGNGRTLLDVSLEAIAEDPVRKKHALELLGGVEPTSIAPTWAPEEGELTAFLRDPDRPTPEEKRLQEFYKRLDYDTRQELIGRSPQFIRDYLTKELRAVDSAEREEARIVNDRRNEQQREMHIKSQAEAAANSAVEEAFTQGFTSFASNICEKFQPIQLVDPQSPEGQQMGPEAVQQANAEIQRINRGVGTAVALLTAASAHPDLGFLVKQVAKDFGITDDVLSQFDAARIEFATNTRNFGHLRKTLEFGPQNGGMPADVSNLQSQAQLAQRRLIAHGNTVAAPLMEMFTKFFSLMAQSHNQTLNAIPQARPSIQGSPHDPTVIPQRPRATSEAEIMARARETANRIAAR